MSIESDSQKSAGQAGAESDGVAYLDQALWSQLQNPVDLDAFGAAWLALLAQNIRGVRAGVLVLLEGADRQLRPIASWPRNWTPTPPVSAAAEAAIIEKTGVARAAQLDEAPTGAAPERCQLAYPILIDGAAAGVVALEADMRARREITLALRQMQWGAAWVERTIRSRTESETEKNLDSLRSAVSLFSVLLDTHGVEEAASALVTEIATALNCDRVSIGVEKPRAMSVLALSHSAQFDKRMNLINAIVRVMEEAADQHTAIALPQDKDTVVVTREHQAFATRNENTAILSAPFSVGGERTGVIVLERNNEAPFSDSEIELVMGVTALAGPIFEDRLDLEKPILKKLAEWSVLEVKKLTGPEDVVRKVTLASLATFALFCIFVTGTFRIAADTRLEGAVRRTIVSPNDGYIDASGVRPGDTIAKGDVLAQLDTSDLRIERLHWLSEKRQASLEYAKAMSTRERAAIGVLSAQIEQADARLELTDLQIERSSLRSPFDGIIVSGDLTQRIGGSVGRGEVLFEIAPLNDYRVVIEVDERDIDYVRNGQRGRLILSSMPSEPVSFTVRAITPVSTSQDGSNFFRVEARLDEASALDKLRPGMEGVAKIDAGKRRMIWIWTHDITNWIRMTLWRWLP